MNEFQLCLYLALMTATGSIALLEPGSSVTEARNRRGFWPKTATDTVECGSPIAALHGTSSKIATRTGQEKDLAAFAALFKDGKRECGATLISPNFLLTAAHCVVNFNGIIKISLGKANNDDTYDPDNTYEIKNVHQYDEEYGKLQHKYHDIALLETIKEVKYKNDVWPYCLPDKHLQINNNQWVRIAGRGLTNGDRQASELKQEYIRFKDEPACKRTLRANQRYDRFEHDYPNGVEPFLLCAGGHGVDSCSGDSGGPMFYNSPKAGGPLTIIGIISSGIGSCPISAQVPGFYTNVENYLDWIYKTIGPQSTSSLYSESGLWDAAKRGDMNYVNGATSTRIDINWKNSYQYHSTALHAAAEANKHQVVRVLLQKGANKNIRDDRGMTPLYVASWSGAREAVNTLIDYSTNVDTPGNNGSTPLMVATWKGHYDIVKALLDANANTYSSNLNRETVLHNAAAYNRPNIAKLLLGKGVDTSARDKWNLTAEELATEQGNHEVARIIRNGVAGLDRESGKPPKRIFTHGVPHNG